MSKIIVNTAALTTEEKQLVIDAGIAALVKSEKLDNAAILKKYDTDFLFLSGAVAEGKKLAIADNKARATIKTGSERMFKLYYPVYGIDAMSSMESYGKPDIRGFCEKVYETFGASRHYLISDTGKVKLASMSNAAAHYGNPYAQLCESLLKWIVAHSATLFTTVEKVQVIAEDGTVTEVEKVVPTFQSIEKTEQEKELKQLDNHMKGINTLSGYIIENVTLDIQAHDASGTPLFHADNTPVMVAVKMNSMVLFNAIVSQTNKELSELLKVERESRAAKIEADKVAKGDKVAEATELPELAEKIAA